MEKPKTIKIKRGDIMPVIEFSLPNSKGVYSANIPSYKFDDEMINDMKNLQDELNELNSKLKKTKTDKADIKKIEKNIEDLGNEMKDISNEYFEDEIEKLRIAKAKEVRGQGE